MLNFVQQAKSLFIRCLECAVATVVTFFESRSPVQTVRLIEEETGTFLLKSDGAVNVPAQRVQLPDAGGFKVLPPEFAMALRGSCAELVLRPSRFMFRGLDFPNRASEFLDGIVRAQIDRLTPWSAAEAAVGWSVPRAVEGADRITLTLAATARAAIAPYVQAIASMGVRSVSVFAPLAEGDSAIQVLEEKVQSAVDFDKTRRILAMILTGASLTAGAALIMAAVFAIRFDPQLDDLQRRIASQRAASQATATAVSGRRMLELRKQEARSSVMVLEVLSRILPDHTHLTELQIEGEKLRLIGFTRDAPSLIAIIEQPGDFARATFFAPTTRSSSSELGERFHVEAQIAKGSSRGHDQ